MPRKSTDSPMMKAAKKVAKIVESLRLNPKQQKGALMVAEVLLSEKLPADAEVAGGD